MTFSFSSDVWSAWKSSLPSLQQEKVKSTKTYNTIPEPLEIGEYVCSGTNQKFVYRMSAPSATDVYLEFLSYSEV